MKVTINIQKRVPANMLWDRYQAEKRQHAAAATLKAKNTKSNKDLAFVQDPHSA